MNSLTLEEIQDECRTVNDREKLDDLTRSAWNLGNTGAFGDIRAAEKRIASKAAKAKSKRRKAVVCLLVACYALCVMIEGSLL